MKLQDTYRDDFILAKSEDRISSYRFQHGKQVYETACIECLERQSKLNIERLNYMLQKENVCAFILVLGLSKYMKYRDFFEFLSYVYDDAKENSIHGEKNLEIIIKFFLSGYENLVMQRQINLNVEQLQESDEIILMKYFDQVINEENPIGRMQELVSKHIKENIILGFSDDEILDLSFIGLFHLSHEGQNLISSKKKRKTRLFLLCLPFVLFYINEQRIFDINATYSILQIGRKQIQRMKAIYYQGTANWQGGFNEADLDRNNYELSDQEEQKLKIIQQKMERSPLFKDLEAKTSSRINNLKNQAISTKGKKKTMQTPAMGGVSTLNQQQNNGNNSQLICSNTGKSPAFISALHKDQQMREPSQAAGILPIQQRDLAEVKVIEALANANDAEKKLQTLEFVQNIMKEPYDYDLDEKLVGENDNPKGLLLEIVMKCLKTHSCLQFKCTQIKAKEFECILLFQDNVFYTRGRAINKKGCEKIAAAKMLPLVEEYVKEREQSNNKPKKVVIFSTHTNQTLKMTDKVNNDFKNHHPQLQKIIQNNLYHTSSNQPGASTEYNKDHNNQDNSRKIRIQNSTTQIQQKQYHKNQFNQNESEAYQISQNQQMINQYGNFYNSQQNSQILSTYSMSYPVNGQTAQPQYNQTNITRTQSQNDSLKQAEKSINSTPPQILTSSNEQK